MLTRITLAIDDQSWPKLHISGERVGATGNRTAFEQKVQYDQAYMQFENLVHNQLRPVVTEIIERRKAAV
jgi:hypothetical protein